MTPRLYLTPVIAAALLMAAAVHAQTPPPNAADDYRKAFESWEGLSEGDREVLRQYFADPNAGISDAVRAAADRARSALDAFRQGASRDSVDWGITYELGPGTLLPHLTPLRDGTRLLALDAQLRLEAGDARGAAESIAASIRMSDHATDDPVLISTLVGAAMFRHTDSAILQRALGEGLLGSGEASMVLDSINGILHEDPFRLTGSLEGEREGMAGWMIENFSEPGGKEAFLDQHAPFLAANDNLAPILTDLAPLSQDGFEVAMQQYDLALADMGAAMNQDDLGQAVADVRDIIDKALRGAYGPLSPHMIPSMDRAIESVLGIYERIEDLRDDLQTIIDDPENGAMKVRNAALWYLRAIENQKDIDAHLWELIAVKPDELSEEDRARIREALPKTEPIVEELLAASKIERCNFDLSGTWKMQGLQADLSHVDGMIRSGELLRAHLIEFVRAGERSEEDQTRAAALLAAAAKMSEHLATDDQLRSARACCAILEAAFDAVDLARGDGETPAVTLAPEALAALRKAAMRDALRYDAAMLAYRDRSTAWLVRRFLDRGGRRDTIMQELSEIAPQSIEPRTIAPPPLVYDDAVAAIRELDRVLEQGVSIARTPAHASEIDVQIEALKLGYAKSWPNDLAAWLLDPLTRTAIAMQWVEQRRRE